MARNWIKIETKTVDKPEVCVVATQLRLDPDAVMGKLVRLWSWAEVNRIDGKGMNVTREFIDKLTGKKGFAAAMEKAGWLVQQGDLLVFPNFSRHNGPAGKGRALTAERVSRHRDRKRNESDQDTQKAPEGAAKKASLVTKTSKPVDDSKSVKAAAEGSKSTENPANHVSQEGVGVRSVATDAAPHAATDLESLEGAGRASVAEESLDGEALQVAAVTEMGEERMDSGVGSVDTEAEERVGHVSVTIEGEGKVDLAEEVEGIEWGSREVDLEGVESVRWEESLSRAQGLNRQMLLGDPFEDRGEAAPAEERIETAASEEGAGAEATSAAGAKEGAGADESGGKTKRSRGGSAAPKKVVVPDSPDQPLLF